ncbi:MAG: DUF1622 domain-containing protein [Gammaproteobacteria bacterium]|nr:DUF1622 domain-containing protein [Gammaproteobacteria bacterium]
MNTVGLVIDAVGVLVIVVGIVIASTRFVFRRQPSHQLTYQYFRQDVARAILLGLEFLIAGDIIRTVAVKPTLENVAVLGLIVLVRTFLSIALHLEVEGRWPWQDAGDDESLGKARRQAGSAGQDTGSG